MLLQRSSLVLMLGQLSEASVCADEYLLTRKSSFGHKHNNFKSQSNVLSKSTSTEASSTKTVDKSAESNRPSSPFSWTYVQLL